MAHWFPLLLLARAGLSVGAIHRCVSNLPQVHYDFIIAGGGTAGNVIASRLSENPNWNVLVIEKGPSQEGITQISVPFFAGSLIGSQYDWNYTTIPQPNLGGRVLGYTRGQVLGGCSSINDMYYTRGAASDFDRYANETGDPGWSWKNLQPYILKNEKWTAPVDNHNTSGQFNPLLHGLNGTVSVSLAALPQAIASRTLQTTQELSDEFPFNLDMNSGKPLGVGWLQTTIDKGQRSSSATAYLSPDVLRRPNLHVVVNTHVTRILKTNDVKGQPVLQGVEVAESSNSIRQNLYASKEVILSAGTIGTPHILLNSGIGDKSELKAFGVKLVLHLPGVGKNFTEMPAIANNWRISSNDTFDDLQRNASVRAQDLQQWQRNKTGPLALTTATHLIYRRVPANSTVFQNETDPSSSVDAPHYEIFTVNGAFGPTPPEGHYIGLVSIVVNPTSRGSVTLNSSDPFQQPLINPGVLDSEFDKFAIREAVKASSRFLEAPAWKDYVVAPIAGLENVTTDAELDEYITQSTVIALHGVGTAQMTAKHASYGVVDPDLCLKGASGLRIVDASVFPHMPASHIQAPIYIFAERAADLIKQSWKKH